MPENFLPANANYITVPTPVPLARLQAILTGIESLAATHPVDPTCPTNSWVTHVYANATQQGLVILYDIPPLQAAGAVQVAAVTGQTDEDKAENARQLIGGGNEFLGYESIDAQHLVVIFRQTTNPAAASGGATNLSWDNVAARQAWSAKLIALVGQHQAQLEGGQPDAFIAGYNGLSGPLKTKFWAEMLVAMARFESSWDPTNVYHEPPPLGVNSIGLLQLSLQDQDNHHLQPRIQNENQLQDPLLNLDWGVQILSRLLARDGVVARGSSTAQGNGGSCYWSVLWVGHKIDLIKQHTRKSVGL